MLTLCALPASLHDAPQALPPGSKVTLFNDHDWSEERLGESYLGSRALFSCLLLPCPTKQGCRPGTPATHLVGGEAGYGLCFILWGGGRKVG